MINPKKVGKTSVALGLSVLILGSNVANAESFKLEKPVNVYLSAYDAKYKTNPVTTYGAGTYNVYRRYDGQINISKTSNPGGWINPSEVSASNVSSQETTNEKEAVISTSETYRNYRTEDSVYVRSGKGTDYSKLGMIYPGTVIKAVKEGDWLKFTYNGRTAYTSAAYYKETTASSSESQTYKNYVTNEAVYIRSGKGSNYSKVGVNYPGTVINAVREGDWLKFTYNGKTAYSFVNFYKETSAESQTPSSQNYESYTTNEAVYIRSGKGSNYSKVGVNYPGTVIEAVREGDWLKFTYNGKTAYSFASFYRKGTSSTQSPSKETYKYYKAEANINVRSGKGTGYSRLGLIEEGSIISAVKEGNWLKLTYDGKTAYTIAEYYREVTTSKPAEKDPFENVKLDKFRATGDVYVRSSISSSDKAIIGSIKKGQTIEGVLEGHWIKFRFNGKVGYTHKNFYTDLSKPSEPLNDKEASYIADYAVNVRSEPSTNSEIVGLIAQGATIKGVKEGSWIRFTYNNRQAYTAADFYSPLSIPETGKPSVSPKQAYIDRIGPTARVLARENDLYASVMIAQSILETGYGTSWLSQSDINNLFGIKGSYNGQYVVMDAFEYDGNDKYYEYSRFKKYPSIRESMLDYVALLTANNDPSRWNYKYYYGVRRSATKSYKDATAYLTGRYATDPRYNILLNQIIELYNLTQYD